MGSLVVIQVPCSYMTSQSDLLIRFAISYPNTHKRPDQHCAPWLTAVGGKVREVSRSDTPRQGWRDRKVCCDSHLLSVDEYVMCEQVNNSTWLQQGSCLFFLYLTPVKSTVNNSACCICSKATTKQIVTFLFCGSITIKVWLSGSLQNVILIWCRYKCFYPLQCIVLLTHASTVHFWYCLDFWHNKKMLCLFCYANKSAYVLEMDLV